MSALTVICCFVLMLASLAGESSEKICAYTGDKVKLLSRIGNDPSLYKEDGTTIASWQDDPIEDKYVNPNYKGRIHMDKDRNIWFEGVEKKDAGRYNIKFGIHEQIHIELIVIELIEEQRQECPNNCPDFPKETSENYIRKGWITWKPWIQKRFCCLYRKTEHLPQSHEISRVTIEEPELTEDQVQCWLDGHPDFVEKYHGKLFEDQIQKSLRTYSNLSMSRNILILVALLNVMTVSSLVTLIICPDDFVVRDRFPEVKSGEEENQTNVSVHVFESNNSPRTQPERNVRSEDPDVDSTSPLLVEENLRRN